MAAQTLACVFLVFFNMCSNVFLIEGPFCRVFSILLALTYYVFFCFAEGIILCLCFLSYCLFWLRGYLLIFLFFGGARLCFFAEGIFAHVF